MEIKISHDELRSRKLMVCTPMYGGMCAGIYTRSMADLSGLCAKYGIDLKYYCLFNESLITRARNYCVDEFLRSDSTHMLFLDADIGFNPNDVIAMLALQSDESPYDVLAAPYPKKTIAWEKIKMAVDKGLADEDPNNLEKYVGDYVFNPANGSTQIRISEPAEIMEAGTGFMMFKKSTFALYSQHYPQYMYKPDHVRTEHFDGSREIMAYFDCIIDPESKRYLSEDYFFCIPNDSRIETRDDGVMTIGNIVRNKYSGYVKSLNSGNQVVWNKIIGWSNRKNNGKKWIKLLSKTDNNTRSKLTCTEDHRVAYFTDVFNPTIDFIEAKELMGKYVVRNVENNRKLHGENPLYNKDQISYLVGTLLGDSSINEVGQLSMTHSEKQQEYITEKCNLFNGKMDFHKNSGFGDRFNCVTAHFPINSQTKKLRELMYINGEKTVKNIIDMIDVKSIAMWYMDDGSIQSGCIRFSTNGFSDEDQNLLVDMFKNKYGIDVNISQSHVTYNEEKRTYNYLRLNVKESRVIMEKIAPYIISSMEYKLSDEFKNVEKISYDNKFLEFSGSLIDSIKHMDKLYSRLYDIEVENDHNFIAQNTLIHNCQNLRKIGGKVWLCPWMVTQHVGSYVFGGSLADLASIGASATANVDELKKGGKKSKGD